MKRKRKGKIRKDTEEVSGERGVGSAKPAVFRIPIPQVPDWLILAIFCFIFLAQAGLSIREKSATFDETVHLPAGYLHLRFGDYSFNPAHPPLVKMLAAVPLLFVDVKIPFEKEPLKDFDDAQKVLYKQNDADRLLFLGRLAVLPVTLLLGWVVFLWTKQLFGQLAASFALFLFAFEPNILAHGPLVNTDMGAACFMFLATFAFYRLVHEFSIRRLALAGLSLGLALVTKFSTLPLLPTLLLIGVGVIVLDHHIEVRVPGFPTRLVKGRMRKLMILLVAAIGMGLIVYGTIWGTYRFRYEGIALPWQTYQAPLDQILSGETWSGWMLLRIKEARLLPEAYFYGFATIPLSLHRLVFLLGKLLIGGVWYYFIVTVLLKTPLALLLLLLVSPLVLRPLWRRDSVAILCLAIPVVFYFGVASAGRLNIGHRHILPIYPFLFVMVGSLVPWVMQRHAVVKGALAALTVWYFVSSVAIFPHYLAYFNELAGGPEGGYKSLVDSNLDWGQDLKGLKRYMDQHGIRRVWLSYFGSAHPDYYGIAYNYLPSYFITDAELEKEQSPYLAISATMLQGAYLPGLGMSSDYFEGFRQREPLAKIGYSIFLYRIE